MNFSDFTQNGYDIMHLQHEFIVEIAFHFRYFYPMVVGFIKQQQRQPNAVNIKVLQSF